MKQSLQIFIIITFMISNNSILGQDIEFRGVYASSSAKKYNTNIGYGLGYHHYFKSKNRVGIIVEHGISNRPYDDIYPSTEDGFSTYIKAVSPSNHRISLKLNYAFNLIDNLKSRFYVGPEIGLNYFIIREQYVRTANGYLTGGSYATSFEEVNRPGIGLLMEFELREVLHRKISMHLTVNPEITSFEKFGLMGGYSPYFIGWMNINLGIRYSLKDDEPNMNMETID